MDKNNSFDLTLLLMSLPGFSGTSVYHAPEYVKVIVWTSNNGIVYIVILLFVLTVVM